MDTLVHNRIRVNGPQAVACVINDFFINAASNVNTAIPKLTQPEFLQVIHSERPVVLNGIHPIYGNEVIRIVK